MAGGVNTLANLLGKVDANNALLVALSGSLPAAAFPLLAPDGTAAAPSYSFTGDTNIGFWLVTANTMGFANASATQIIFQTNLMQFGSGGRLSWTSSADASGAGADLSLFREGADHLFQRNALTPTTAQRASWANTYTSATNYEAFSVDWQTTANTALVGTRTAATGTQRAMHLVSQAANGGTAYTTLALGTIPFGRFDYATAALGAANNTATGNWFQIGGAAISTATSGTIAMAAILPTYNQSSGTAANTDLLINRTQTAIGSGSQFLIDAQVATVSQFYVRNDGFVNVANGYGIVGNRFISSTAPTISSGFGTSPSVVGANGTVAFTINVGTGGTASAGVIGLPTSATGWVLHIENITAQAANRASVRTCQTASSTTTATIQNQNVATGAATAWAASDILHITAMAR